MNTQYRKPLPGTGHLEYFDTRASIDSVATGAYDRLPYTSRVLAENLVRRCDPADLEAALATNRRTPTATWTSPGTRPASSAMIFSDRRHSSISLACATR